MKKSIVSVIAIAALLLGAESMNAQSAEKPLSLKEALSQRQSIRSYSDKKLTDKQILDILWAANGVNEYDKRTAPSAMNRQDIDLYVCKSDGTWKYDAKNAKLKKITKTDIRPILKGRNKFVDEAPITILLITDQSKFGDNKKAMTFGLLDAGIVSQNISLYCTSIGLGTVACAPNLDEEKIQKALKLSSQQVPVLYHPVGYAAE